MNDYFNDIIKSVESDCIKLDDNFPNDSNFSNDNLNIFDNKLIKMWNLEIDIYNLILNDNVFLKLNYITDNNFTLPVYEKYSNYINNVKNQYKDKLRLKLCKSEFNYHSEILSYLFNSDYNHEDVYESLIFFKYDNKEIFNLLNKYEDNFK